MNAPKDVSVHREEIYERIKREEDHGEGAAPKWNFHKYLVGKDGTVAGVFPSMVKPQSPEMIAAVEAALAK